MREEEEAEKDRVVKTKRFPLKPMHLEEAIMQMNLLGHDFFVFANAETESVNAVSYTHLDVYKRQGKTTTIRALLSLFYSLNQAVLLAAPTGRAAKRVNEATGEEAFTIHRLLEYSYIEGEGFRFLRHEKRPLEADVLIVDEASMVDLMLMCQLVKAIPAGCRLIMVGDVDQLPAVGAGNVLRDLLESGAVPAVRLNHIFRQARESLITVNAHRINRGKMPHLNAKNKDFFFINEAIPDLVAQKVVCLLYTSRCV